MNENELNKIRRSFVRAEKCSTEAACLLTVIKYYGGTENRESINRYFTQGKHTLATIQRVADQIGLSTHLYQLTIDDLCQRKLPVIIFAKDDFGKMDFAVCYGLHEGRFIVWEPNFGPMQYWPNELNHLWVLGICMTIYPTAKFESTYHLKWWELYSWTRKIRKWIECIKEYISLEILPLFRW